jgi:multidrug efflux system membrane fusion protein
MKRSVYLSIGLLGAVTAWMLSGSLVGASRNDKPSPMPEAAPESRLMKVRVAVLQSGTVTREVVVQGQLEPRRRVEIRAETAGQVRELSVEKGARVAKGDVIVRLAEDDRVAQLARAEAEVESRRLDLSASEKLGSKGMQAQTQVKAAQAALAAAEAELERLRIDLEHTSISAPFDGVVETRAIELGSLLERADPVVELVDASVLKAVGHVPQQSAGSLALGQTVKVRLLDDRTAEGRITYLARVADSGTRSFRVEAEVPNPDGTLFSGVSAELRIAVAEETGHFLSPAVLTLDDSGRVGVKAVDEEDRVAFFPISLVRSEADGVWVSGLPERVRVITEGQGFVIAGETVEPVADRRGAS